MKIAIATSEAPQARGPYSQAISAGDYLFVAGQIPIDPKTGQLIEGEIEALTIRVLDNIEAILKAAGLSLKHVVKTDVFLRDLNDFNRMNQVYATRFSEPLPARVTIQAAKLPLDCRIEISCIAYKH